MRALFSYAVTESLKQRWLDAKKYCVPLNHLGWGSLLITDFDHPDAVNIGKDQGSFCLPRFRNAAIDHAIKYHYDLLVIGDADSVFLPDTLNENTIYSTALVAHLNEGETPFMLRGAEHGVVQFKPCSWFILHRSVFLNHRFDEEYKGYGYEDLEFNRRLNRNGIHYDPRSLLAYHMWHPIAVNSDEMARNHERYLTGEKTPT